MKNLKKPKEKKKRIVFGNDSKNLFENLFVCGVLI